MRIIKHFINQKGKVVQAAICMHSHTGILSQVHGVALCTSCSCGALAFPVCKQN